jgi:TRAP-type C4-dicarboxylate transport system permease small subunit
VRMLEILVILAMTALVIDVLLGVGTRQLGMLKFWMLEKWSISLGFLPDGQIKWSEELARFLMVWASLLGAALAFERRAHLGVDFFASKFHPSTRRLAQTIAHLLVMAFAVLILIKGGVTLVEHARSSGQITPALGLRKWIVYLVVPVSGVFVIIFTIENMIADLRRNHLDEEVPE